MKSFLFLFLIIFNICFSQTQKRKVYTTTPTYSEIISFYESCVSKSPYFKLFTYGLTDVGKPLHLFVISKNKMFDPDSLKKSNKRILLINNGIHPGEPDGIDASMELIKSFIDKPSNIPNDLVVCIIPVYNIDGCLNRGKFSRANQNGPDEYGFRGNRQNLDLNRDFIKADSKNAQTFIQIFQIWKPDLFLDTHTSDGADYQYIMTLISTQRDKLHPLLSNFMVKDMLPMLYGKMKERKYEMSPYVDHKGKTPDSGLVEFMETPRFASGYTAQFNCIGFISEAHMWKPYNDRVWATYEFIYSLIETAQTFSDKIGVLRKQADDDVKTKKVFNLNYVLDTTVADQIEFKGYEAYYKTSAVSGLKRLAYDRTKPYTKKIPFYNHYNASVSVIKPSVYIVPQAWVKIIERLKMNNVEMSQLRKDTSLLCTVYYIKDFETSKRPYEGHYIHFNTKVKSDQQTMQFFKDDYIIQTDQMANRYIVETLDPQGDDSFFAWGFFDAILQQKEWFSDYVFEDRAEEILRANPELKAKLEKKKAENKSFASSAWEQLTFIYRNSVYYEPSHNRYPIGMME
ncbi:MAG TPA: M14 family zinc carboxypeptidase [Bacteroidia bacterium]|nr:M14 family zinc carboxypeptidase [Bacteroidia bacterium]